MRYSKEDISFKEFAEELEQLNRSIKNLLYKAGEECDNLRYNADDLDQSFIRNGYYNLTDKLYSISRDIKYLSNPIIDQGYLYLNEQGRYGFSSGEYLTSGSLCEALYNDEKYGEQYWLKTIIKHNGEDYYADVLGEEVSLKGMMARVRARVVF